MTHLLTHPCAVQEAKGKISEQLMQRLKLKPQKIKQLAEGLRSIASQEEPIGKTLSRMEIVEGLQLQKVTAPIGVLLIIFEARPDALPQIAALAIRSGNGLLLKGGKEAARSNACLHKIIPDTIAEAQPEVRTTLSLSHSMCVCASEHWCVLGGLDMRTFLWIANMQGSRVPFLCCRGGQSPFDQQTAVTPVLSELASTNILQTFQGFGGWQCALYWLLLSTEHIPPGLLLGKEKENPTRLSMFQE